MRVNIQYSIEMDEIPGKVTGFLHRASAAGADIVHDIDDIAFCMEGDFSIENAIERMDKIRRELANIDHIMLDCTEILHGYQKALVQLREPLEPPTSLTEENHDSETRHEETEEG